MIRNDQVDYGVELLNVWLIGIDYIVDCFSFGIRLVLIVLYQLIGLLMKQVNDFFVQLKLDSCWCDIVQSVDLVGQFGIIEDLVVSFECVGDCWNCCCGIVDCVVNKGWFIQIDYFVCEDGGDDFLFQVVCIYVVREFVQLIWEIVD